MPLNNQWSSFDQSQNNISMGYQNNQNQINQQNAGFGMSRTSPTRPSYILGRVVMSESDILPNEVPMDGNFGTFVQQDLKRIYAKTWGVDGRIYTNIYELVTPNQTGETKTDPGLEAVMGRLDDIDKAIKEIIKDRPYYQPRKKSYNQNSKRENTKNVKEEEGERR